MSKINARAFVYKHSDTCWKAWAVWACDQFRAQLERAEREHMERLFARVQLPIPGSLVVTAKGARREDGRLAKPGVLAFRSASKPGRVTLTMEPECPTFEPEHDSTSDPLRLGRSLRSSRRSANGWKKDARLNVETE